MVIEKTTVEVETRVKSEDGMYCRYIRDVSEEARAQAVQDVRNYEESAKGVIFARLAQKGVMSTPLRWVRETAENPLTEEQKKDNLFFGMLDCVIDNGYGNANYYFFVPKDEQDIKDLATYTKLNFGVDLFSNTDNEASRFIANPEVGKSYIYMANSDSEWAALISLDALEKRVSKMCDYWNGRMKTFAKGK